MVDLRVIDETEPAREVRAPVDPDSLEHRQLLDGPFWQRIPEFAEVSEEDFLDYRWQQKHSITRADKLLSTLRDLVPAGFVEDARAGFRVAPMAVRVSPYLLSLIDWSDPWSDPLRRQFIPLGSTRLPDHPKLTLDSLAEQEDAPVPGLTHRYPDKVLFLALDTCPVYCRFCTRSYAVGPSQETVEKVSLKATRGRWHRIIEYLGARPEVEDVVISGGDMWNLRSDHIRELGNRLLDVPHVRRMRFATKGPAVMPQKLLTDPPWYDAFMEVVERGRSVDKDVVLHTHFNHPNEITEITRQSLSRLFRAGVKVRNQSVLQRGVNDTVETMTLLVKRLAWINVQPYYVYQHDLVKGTEELRTRVLASTDLEKAVRGTVAGFNTPTFVVDAPGGGGKRSAHSYEHYDLETGISVYTAPSVKPGRAFLYFDPVDLLPEAGRARWADPDQHARMIDEALEQAREGARASGAPPF